MTKKTIKRNFKRFLLMTAVFYVLTCTVVSFAAFEKPQRYSTDEYTSEEEFQKEIDAVEIPEEKVQNGIAVWLNKEEVKLSKKAVYKNGMIYVSLKEFFEAAGYDVKTSGKKVTVSKDGISSSAKVGSTSCDVNGESKKLNHSLKKIKGTVMASADFIKEVMDAKVWYDEDGKTFAVTVGSMKDDGILRIINGKLYMDGQPYYEISFNKWDLAYQISSSITTEAEWRLKEHQYSAAEEALKMLHDNGFKTIRVFVNSSLKNAYFRSDKQKEKFYEEMDLMFDLLDKYEIKITCCMGLTSTAYVAKGESIGDLYCIEDSQSRKNVYQYIDDFVTRYKDRDSVLMWEIENEGNLQLDIGWTTKQLQPSARHLGQYYEDVAARIKMNDPERLVTGGDGELRGSQFNLYKGTRLGMIGSNWQQDTLEERLKILQIIYHGVDVISVHSYDAGRNEIFYQSASGKEEDARHQDLTLYMDECKSLGKVLYNGETSLSCLSLGYDDSGFTQEEIDEYVQETIDAGVQLTHYWCFHCDREGHDAEDTYSWMMYFGKGLEAVKKGNENLKAKYVVNGLDDSAETSGCGGVAGTLAALISTTVCAAFVLLKKKENK